MENIVSVIPDIAIDVGESNICLARVQVWVQPENLLCSLLRRLLKFTIKIQWVELPQKEKFLAGVENG